MWSRVLNRQADNVATVLILSFVGALFGAIGLRRSESRWLAALCLTVSGLFLVGLGGFLLLVLIAFSSGPGMR